MNILYCGDKKAEDGLLISILSLLEHNTGPLCIYVLTLRYKTGKINCKSEVEKNDRFAAGRAGTINCEPAGKVFVEYLDKLVKKKDVRSFVKRIDVSDRFLKELPVKNMKTRFTLCCMLRLFADEIEGIPDKILYLDNDVVCRRSIKELYEQDIEAYELAGVPDHYGRWFFGSHKKRPLFQGYLNSGVLLLNMKKIRENGLFEKCRRLCREKWMFMPDQSAINKLAKDKKVLARKYNEQRKLRKDTVLQHFTTSFRFFPWLHTLTVKPWQVERMHTVLKLHEYDTILEKYQKVKCQMKMGKQ